MVRVWVLSLAAIAVVLFAVQASRSENLPHASSTGVPAAAALRAYAGPDGRFTEPPAEAERSAYPEGEQFRGVQILPGQTAAGGIRVVYGDRWLHELRVEADDRGDRQERCGPTR